MNGETRNVEQGTTIVQLLDLLKLQPDRVVVELNRRVLNVAEQGKTLLREGDNLEIIRFVGGG
ncbi:MAG: sulfur carrier protein ThiS [Deltaproteobacteria bacterium]|nr:sulfur carrier protein ThiS [Deltaproteobacteria bacterium]